MAYDPHDVATTSSSQIIETNKETQASEPPYEAQNPQVRNALNSTSTQSTTATSSSTQSQVDSGRGFDDSGSRDRSSSSRTDDSDSGSRSSLATDVAKNEVLRAKAEAEATAVKAAEAKDRDVFTLKDIVASEKADEAAATAKGRLESLFSRTDDNKVSKTEKSDDAGSMAADVKAAEVKRAKAEAEAKAEKAAADKTDDKSTIGEIAKADKVAADAKEDLESLVRKADRADSSDQSDDMTLEEIIAELEGNYGLDWQNGKYLGSPPGGLPGAGQIMSNILYGRSQRPDPRLADLTEEELYNLEIGQQLGSSMISNGIIFGLGSSIDDLAAQYAPGYLKFPTALAGKVAVGRLVNPIAQEGSDIISDWQGDPNVIPGPGIVSMENLGDVAPSAASIVIGSAAGSGVKQLALAAAAAGIAIPDPVTTLLGLGTAMYVGSEIYVAADNYMVPDLLPNEVFIDPVNPPTIEEYEAMLAEYILEGSPQVVLAAASEVEPEEVLTEESVVRMPTKEELEAIWGSNRPSDSLEELEIDPASLPESGETLELGPKYPSVVLEEPAERSVAQQPAGEVVPEETLEESAVKLERVTDGDRSPEALSVKPVDIDDFPVRPISELPETWKTFVDRVKSGFDQMKDLASNLPERFIASEETGPKLIIDTRPIPEHLKDSKPSDEPTFTFGDIPRLRENDDHHRGEGIGGVSPSCKIDLWMAKYVTELLELGVTDLCQFEGWTEKQLKSQIKELQMAGSSPDLSEVTYAVACTFGHEDDFQFLNDRPDVDYGVDLFQI